LESPGQVGIVEGGTLGIVQGTETAPAKENADARAQFVGH